MNPKHTLTVLNRLANRKPRKAAQLERALRGRLDTLASTALEVAVETGDPIGRMMAKKVRDGMSHETVRVLVDKIGSEVYRSSVPLRELGLAVTRSALEQWQASEAATEGERIQALNNLGFWLRASGDPESALRAVEQAVELSRRSTSDASLRNTARNLHSLSTLLADLERREEALSIMAEALNIDRQLAAEDPEHEMELVSSLQNFGAMQWDLSRFKDALLTMKEAVTRGRKLAQDPTGRGRSLLANGLHNVGAILDDLGEREEALQALTEAVGIRRELVEAHEHSYRPDLASSLHNLAIVLGALNRPEESVGALLECLKLREDLARSRPGPFKPALARTLSVLGNRLRKLGRAEEALPHSQRAVDLYRRLAETKEGLFQDDLAASLNNLSLVLGDVGRREESLRVAEQAVAIYRRLVAGTPGAFEQELAGSLHTYAESLRALDRLEMAEPILDERRTILAAIKKQAVELGGQRFNLG